MAISDILADTLFKLGHKISLFSRKKSEAEQKAELLAWDRPHIVLSDGGCCVCNKPDVDHTSKCPGPPIKGYRK